MRGCWGFATVAAGGGLRPLLSAAAAAGTVVAALRGRLQLQGDGGAPRVLERRRHLWEGSVGACSTFELDACMASSSSKTKGASSDLLQEPGSVALAVGTIALAELEQLRHRQLLLRPKPFRGLDQHTGAAARLA